MPAGGSAAAAAVAMAAGLVEKAARLSRGHLIDAPRFVKHCEITRQVATSYIDADAYVYTRYVEALREARGRNAKAREQILRQPRGGIIEMPVKVARLGAEVAEMAFELARKGNPNLRSDAYVALQLAAAATRASAATLAANVDTSRGEARLEEVRRLAAAASELARRPAAPRRAGARGRGPARPAGSGRR